MNHRNNIRTRGTAVYYNIVRDSDLYIIGTIIIIIVVDRSYNIIRVKMARLTSQTSTV